ncbi:type II toxin-antitoxin system VapC family toxin (plasmid) [Cereibacter azotoformans]|uniref:type II toxin-antitoxin system VapC family toxin n=1 Tax=Cereibacter azotoformans TaxID=43057 RepID=UPI003B21EB75
MLLLDTNVISELMRVEPAATVLDWFGIQDPANLFISAVTEAELRAGVAFLPNGQRRDKLQSALEGMIAEDFPGRVLPFDSRAARAYADIAALRRNAGRPIFEADCQIAAIARAAGATVVTRNTKDFDGCGVELINPWIGTSRLPVGEP